MDLIQGGKAVYQCLKDGEETDRINRALELLRRFDTDGDGVLNTAKLRAGIFFWRDEVNSGCSHEAALCNITLLLFMMSMLFCFERDYHTTNGRVRALLSQLYRRNSMAFEGDPRKKHLEKLCCAFSYFGESQNLVNFVQEKARLMRLNSVDLTIIETEISIRVREMITAVVGEESSAFVLDILRSL
jgi:hypothetical protein